MKANLTLVNINLASRVKNLNLKFCFMDSTKILDLVKK